MGNNQSLRKDNKLKTDSLTSNAETADSSTTFKTPSTTIDQDVNSSSTVKTLSKIQNVIELNLNNASTIKIDIGKQKLRIEPPTTKSNENQIIEINSLDNLKEITFTTPGEGNGGSLQVSFKRKNDLDTECLNAVKKMKTEDSNDTAAADTSSTEAIQSFEQFVNGPFFIYKKKDTPKTGLRPIAIDASNIGVGYIGNGQKNFSVKGLEIAILFFERRGHTNIKAFLPAFRKTERNCSVYSRKKLENLEKNQQLVFTPCRTLNGKVYISYDDRFLLAWACENDAIVVSNDKYADLCSEYPRWKNTIEKRLLMYAWSGQDMLTFTPDPLGRYGPGLDEFLRF